MTRTVSITAAGWAPLTTLAGHVTLWWRVSRGSYQYAVTRGAWGVRRDLPPRPKRGELPSACHYRMALAQMCRYGYVGPIARDLAARCEAEIVTEGRVVFPR